MEKRFRRKRELKKKNPRVLIVVPGKSEKEYFEVRKTKKRNHALTIRVKTFSDSNPQKTIAWANTQKVTVPTIRQKLPYDIIYYIFDHDNDDQVDFKKDARIDKLCSNADSPLYFYSNPCFEIWLQMHFREVRRFTTRKNAIKWVEDNVINYKKGASFDGYSDIINKEKTAIKNAVLALEKHIRDGIFKPSERNPSSTMYWLLQAIDKK